MGFPSKRIAVDDSEAVQVLANYEGAGGTLVNRGPDDVVIAGSEAAADPGTGDTDATVDSFTLKIGEGVDLESAGGRNDQLWAACAAGETACLHLIAEN